MVISIDEYLSRRRACQIEHTAQPALAWSFAAATPRCGRGLSPAPSWPAQFAGAAALALRPDDICLPTASELGTVYAEATLI